MVTCGGPRLRTQRESRFDRVEVGVALLAVGVVTVLVIAVPMPGQVTAGLLLALLGAGSLWGVWTYFAR